MPEVVTKFPDILIKELKDAGGKCGIGAPQTILKTCPRSNFCLLPTGEICVYSLDNINEMTQIPSSQWREAVTHIPSLFSSSNLILMLIIFGLGVLLGDVLRKKNKK